MKTLLSMLAALMFLPAGCAPPPEPPPERDDPGQISPDNAGDPADQ